MASNDDKDEYSNEIEYKIKEIGDAIQGSLDRWNKANKLLQFLEIPTANLSGVQKIALYDMIMDADKRRSLVSKLNLIAFW